MDAVRDLFQPEKMKLLNRPIGRECGFERGRGAGENWAVCWPPDERICFVDKSVDKINFVSSFFVCWEEKKRFTSRRKEMSTNNMTLLHFWNEEIIFSQHVTSELLGALCFVERVHTSITAIVQILKVKTENSYNLFIYSS